jgi:serine/threonine protein kinase
MPEDNPQPPPGPTQQSTVTYSPPHRDPERIGPYKIFQKLGEGGMGVVYRAEQEQPIRRRVALKLIKLGMDTKAVIGRFEAERQALAMMDHPNVAKVFDAGATDQGRPYFAMEYVKGIPITEHCDRQRLTTGERLQLFMRVCEGVQHAHQKGIIHRDIKPSNVLVAVEGDRAVPKIIDFGVAKATEHRLAEQTIFTELGQIIGTPEYMSPEQAEMTNQDIDTRTDVYSLGVTLYELLVGALPFDSKDLREAGFDEIRRRIREEEPSKPSTRIGTLGEAATGSARSRRTDVKALRRLLAGELDWIVMKALEKDRTRRYDSPRELAMDAARYLNDEPVSAGPPSAAYRAGKFVRRHRVGIGIAAAAVVLLVTFGVMMGGLAQRFAAERQALKSVLEFQVKAPILQRQQNYNELLVLSLDNLEIQKRVLGDDNPSTLYAILVLADVYKQQGLLEDAEPLLFEVLRAAAPGLTADWEPSFLNLYPLISLPDRPGPDRGVGLKAPDPSRVPADDEWEDLTLRSVTGIFGIACAHERRGSPDDHAKALGLLRDTLDEARRIIGDDHDVTDLVKFRYLSMILGGTPGEAGRKVALELLREMEKSAGEAGEDKFQKLILIAHAYKLMGDSAKSKGALSLMGLEESQFHVVELLPEVLWDELDCGQ